MVLFFATLITLPAAADDPLVTLVEDYGKYGLPLPPKEARLVILTRSTGTFNGVPQYSHTLALVTPDQDQRPARWVGCRASRLSRGVTVKAAEPTREAIEKTEPAHGYSWSSGFPTYPDLALAIHCKARGFDEPAMALLERSRKGGGYDPFDRRPARPRDDRKALAALAWNYWCNEFVLSKGNRGAIVRRLRKLGDGPFGLNTRAHQNIISDMEKTLVPSEAKAGSLEAAIDSLVDLGIEGGWRGEQFADLGYSTGRHIEYQRLRDQGLAAAPVLIKHAHDFRLTRCLAHSSRGTWHIRIADVVRELLNGLVAEEFAFDFRIREGRGNTVDRAHVLHWWSEVEGTRALEYLLQNALVEEPDGKLRGNEHVLHALGNRYPEELVKLFEENVEKVEDSYALFDALGASKTSRESKARLLLSAAKSKDSLKRDFSLRQLLRMNHPDAVPLLVKELDGIPKTPKEAYWTSSAGRFAQLVCSTDDERVWKALLRNAKRVDIGQRLEMIQAVGSRSGRKDEQVIQFLRAFLDDREVRVIKNRFPDLTKLTDPNKALDKVMADLFHGPSAGFTFGRLEVRDFAALEIACKLELDVSADSAWKEEDWAELRKEVRAALAERNTTSSENGKDK